MENQTEQSTPVATQEQGTIQRAQTMSKRTTGKKRHHSTFRRDTKLKRQRHRPPEADDYVDKPNEGGSTVATQDVGELGKGHTCDVALKPTSTVDRHNLHIDSLPHLILLHIFRCLSLHDLLHRVCLVSKHWWDIARDPDLWRVVNLKGQNKVTDEVIKRLTGYSHNVLCVDVTDSRLVTNEGISLVAQQCTQLRVLKLIRCLQLTDQAFTSIAANCPHLTTLCLDVCFALTDKAVEKMASGCHKLQVLCLNQCSKVTDAGIKAIGKGCPELKTLSLDQCVKVSDACLPDLVTGCPQLEVVRCMKCDLTTCGLAQFTRLSQLRVLEVSQIASVNNESVMKIVRHCRHLESLDLSLCTNITDICVDFIAKYVRNLRSLHLVSCSLTDQALISLGAHSRTIETLDVGWCEHITAQGAIKISETCPTLRYLGLMRCDLITIPTMELLVEKFPRVKFSTMWLDCNRLIQMARSQGFLQSAPSLR